MATRNVATLASGLRSRGRASRQARQHAVDTNTTGADTSGAVASLVRHTQHATQPFHYAAAAIGLRAKGNARRLRAAAVLDRPIQR